jgi:hypothetical protein
MCGAVTPRFKVNAKREVHKMALSRTYERVREEDSRSAENKNTCEEDLARKQQSHYSLLRDVYR